MPSVRYANYSITIPRLSDFSLGPYACNNFFIYFSDQFFWFYTDINSSMNCLGPWFAIWQYCSYFTKNTTVAYFIALLSIWGAQKISARFASFRFSLNFLSKHLLVLDPYCWDNNQFFNFRWSFVNVPYTRLLASSSAVTFFWNNFDFTSNLIIFQSLVTRRRMIDSVSGVARMP